jgi:hypothetical protein
MAVRRRALFVDRDHGEPGFVADVEYERERAGESPVVS